MRFLDPILGRKQQPPPPFRHKFDIGAIAANASIDYNSENTLRHFRKFSPYTFIFVRNMSATAVKVRLDYTPDTELEAVSKGEATSKNIPFSSFQVINDTAVAVLADEITVWIERIV